MKKFMMVMLWALAGCTTIIQQPAEPEEPEPTAAPIIVSFTADPATISTPGEPVVLGWEYEGNPQPTLITISSPAYPEDLFIDKDDTIQVVFPAETTTYTLTVSNRAGESSAQTTVTLE